MPEPAAHDETSSHPCPECGGDTAVLRHRPRVWSERAVHLPVCLWILLMILLMALVTPWVQSRLGSPFAIYHSTVVNGTAYASPIDPGVSAAEIAEQSEPGLRRLDGALDVLGEQYGPWWAGIQLRFVFVEKAGMRYDQRERGLGGAWVSEVSNTQLADVRHEPTGDGPWDYPIEDVIRTQFNGHGRTGSSSFGLEVERVRLDGGQWYRRNWNLVNFLSSLAVLVLMLSATRRGIAWWQRRRGRPSRPKHLRWGVVYTLCIVVFVVLGYHHEHGYHHMAGRNITPGTLLGSGPWLDADEVEHLLIGDPDRSALLEYLEPMAADAPGDAILAYQTVLSVDSNLTQYSATMGASGELMSVSIMRYTSTLPDGSTRAANRPAYHAAGFDIETEALGRWIGVSYHSDRATHSVTVYWTRLILLGLVCFVALGLLRLIGRQLAYRTQRKRVRRGQCIFCAYPLSPDALAARSGDSGS